MKQKIKKSIVIGNFNYKISEEDLEFIKSNPDSVDLATKYVAYKIYQKSKNLDHYISYNEFSKIYFKAKKVKTFERLEEYTNELLYEFISNALNVYIDYIRENWRSVTLTNSISSNQYIRYSFVGDDKVLINKISNEETIKKYNQDFIYKEDNTYPFTNFIYHCIKLKFYPNEDNIFDYCRSNCIDYYTAMQRIIGDKNIEYEL